MDLLMMIWPPTRHLYDLVREKRWNDALQHCQKRPSDAKYTNERGWSPLHLLCSQSVTCCSLGDDVCTVNRCEREKEERTKTQRTNHKQIMIRKMIALIKALHEANPKAVQTTNCHGTLPLHISSSHCHSSLQIVQYIFYLYPQAICTPDMDGHYPLHYAASGGAPNAESSGAPLDVVVFLHKSYQHAITMKDKIYDALPLHLACYPGKETSVSVIQYLCNAYPEASYEIDAGGETPRDCIENGQDREEDEKQRILEILSRGERKGRNGRGTRSNCDRGGHRTSREGSPVVGSGGRGQSKPTWEEVESGIDEIIAHRSDSRDEYDDDIEDDELFLDTLEVATTNTRVPPERCSSPVSLMASYSRNSALDTDAAVPVATTMTVSTRTAVTTTISHNVTEDGILVQTLQRFAQNAKYEAIQKYQLALEAERRAERAKMDLLEAENRKEEATKLADKKRMEAIDAENLALRLQERASSVVGRAITTAKGQRTCCEEEEIVVVVDASMSDSDDAKALCEGLDKYYYDAKIKQGDDVKKKSYCTGKENEVSESVSDTVDYGGKYFEYVGKADTDNGLQKNETVSNNGTNRTEMTTVGGDSGEGKLKNTLDIVRGAAKVVCQEKNIPQSNEGFDDCLFHHYEKENVRIVNPPRPARAA